MHSYVQMASRKIESGAKYKTLREERREKEAETSKKVPRLESFFAPVSAKVSVGK